VICVACSPNGEQIASGLGDKSLRLWNTCEGTEILKIGTDCVPLCLSFSHNGTQIAAGMNDKSIRLWGVKGGTESFRFYGHQSRLLSVTFSPDDMRIASSSSDETIRLWEITTRDSESFVSENHRPTHKILCLAMSPDGTQVAYVSSFFPEALYIGKVAQWAESDIDSPSADEMIPNQASVEALAFSPDGSKIVYGLSDSTIQVWDSHEECLMSTVRERDPTTTGPERGGSNPTESPCKWVDFNP
jgi:WD40 repeat protein